MTISSTQNRITYGGNGVTTLFPFPYDFIQDVDLVVILVESSGSARVKTLNTDYTIPPSAGAVGGYVQMVVAPNNGETLLIIREPSPVQAIHLVENDPLPVSSVEQELDLLTMLVQRLTDLMNRAVVLPDAFLPAFNTQLPNPLTPNACIAVDPTGALFVMGPTVSAITAASANAASAAVSASTASTAAAQAIAAAASIAATALLNVSFVNSPISAPITNTTYICNTTGGGIVVNLPPAGGNSQLTITTKNGPGTGNITVNPNGTDLIEGVNAAQVITGGNRGSLTFLCDGTGWNLI